MPTGRPDYWYGTALYFEENPADGEVTRGPTSNWAYDHVNSAGAHQTMYDPADEVVIDLNGNTAGDVTAELAWWGGTAEGSKTFKIIRYGGAGGYVLLANSGTGAMHFNVGGSLRMKLLAAGGVEEIWDDTPTNGEVTKGVTSDWAFDHDADASAHHAPYVDAEAVAAVKAIVDDAAVDGETDIPISSNWAFDHDADASAHHAIYDEKLKASLALGYSVLAAGNRLVSFYTDDTTTIRAYIQRNVGANGLMYIYQKGTGNLKLNMNGGDTITFLSAGGMAGAWDDTPTNGQQYKGVSSDWAFDHTADHTAHGATFVDRGDAAAWDFIETDLTRDANWYDLDLSGVVPAGAISVLLRVKMSAVLPGNYIGFRQKGDSNGFNESWGYTQVNGITIHYDKIIAVDGDRTIQYYTTANATSIDLCIGGWWI